MAVGTSGCYASFNAPSPSETPIKTNTPIDPSSCSAGTATADQVLEGIFFSGSNGIEEGNIKALGDLDISTMAFSQASLVTSLTAPALSAVCSTAQLFGQPGTANCGSMPPSISVSGGSDLNWGLTTSAPSSKLLQFSISGTGRTFAKVSFTGDSSAFSVVSVGGLQINQLTSSGPILVPIASDVASSVNVSLKPKLTTGAAKTVNISIEDSAGDTIGSYTASATVPVPFVGASLKLWLKADDITALSDGDKISTWNDASGGSNHAAESDANYQPLYSATGANGLPSVRFDGTNDKLLLNTAISTAKTIFIVLKHRTGSQDNYPILLGDSAIPAMHGDLGDKLFGYWGSFYGTGTTYVNGTLTTTSTVTKPTQWTVLSLINAGTISVDRISEDRNLSRGWDGEFAEIIILDNTWTGSRSEVECYLGDKFNLVVSGC